MFRASPSGTPRESDSATLPYPVRQAIATPTASRSRGDWGLKRPLPLKSTTASSTPEIRIGAMDTLEHVTEFTGASDHTQTLRKFQQMSVPMLGQHRAQRFLGERTGSNVSFRSAFEEEDDNTYIAEAREGGQSSADATVAKGIFGSLQAAQPKRQWKYDGPWLGGMTPGDFNLWMKKVVKLKKGEFQRLLREHIVDKMWADRLNAARKAAVEANVSNPQFDPNSADLTEHYRTELDGARYLSREEMFKALEPDLPADIAAAPAGTPLAVEFHAHIRSARSLLLSDPQLSALLQSVLKLPPLDRNFNDGPALFDSVSLNGPPLTTHPSAGLSYLRTNAHMTNHPLVGPRGAPTPVRARILAPARTQQSRKAKLGIAGFVVQDDADVRSTQAQAHRFLNLNADAYGGKLWASVEGAEVDSMGRVKLKYQTVADRSDEVNVKKGEYERPDVGQRVARRTSFARSFL